MPNTASVAIRAAALVYFVSVAAFAADTKSNSGMSAPPKDVKAMTRVDAGGFRRDLSTGDLVQAVNVTNLSELTIEGPLYLVVDRVKGASRVVSTNSKRASDEKDVFALSGAGPKGGLQPKEAFAVLLRFEGAAGNQVGYNARLAASEE